MSTWIRIISILTLSLLPHQLLIAADIRYNAGLSFAHYDNLNLESSPDDNATSSSVNAGFTILDDNADLFISLDTDVVYTNYNNNQARDEVSADQVANVIWRLRPGQFEWHLNNRYTQTVIDAFSSDTPNNRQNINIFSTGPNYTIRLNSNSNLQLELRGENYNFEEDLDNNRAQFAFRLLHNLNAAWTITFNNEVQTINYMNNDISDLNRNDLFIGMDYVHGLNYFNAEFGYTNASNDSSASNEVDSNRYLLSITNARTRNTSIRFIYENILSDAGTEIAASNIDDNLNASTSDTLANDIFIDEVYRFQVMNELSNGNIVYGISTTNREYKLQIDLDEEINTATIDGVLNLGRAHDLAYNLGYVETAFQNSTLERIDKDYIYRLTYSYGYFRNTNINLELETQERISTIELESYEDLRFILSLNFTSS